MVCHASIALLEPSPAAKMDAGLASLLVKARLAVAATAATTNNTVVPSCLQGRVAAGHPLPSVVQQPAALPLKAYTPHRKFCSLVKFVLGMEGGSDKTGMPAGCIGVGFPSGQSIFMISFVISFPNISFYFCVFRYINN